MKYVNCKQKSIEWQITERRIRQLCAEGKIEGAYKSGSIWLIPEKALQPENCNNYEKNKKSILITGASRGIGKATAIKFLQNDWIVYGTYFSSLDNIRDLIAKYPKTFIPVGPYDLRKLDQISKLVSKLKNNNFDAIFMNAGIFSENDDFINFDLQEFNFVMNCNFYAPMIISIQLKNNIKTNGSIVLMSSNDAYSGAFASISYSTSKQAILSLVKSLSVNFGKKGIRVNSIAPGAIDTDMNTPEQVNESPNWTPLQRVAQPYEVANVVYFLCGNESSFINGENITVDGGYGNVSILLKKEMESSRIYGGYDCLIDRYNKAKVNETILSIDVPDSGYAWQNNSKEIDYLNSIVNAQKRGVNCCRYIVMPYGEIESFKTHNKIYSKYKNLIKNMFIISMEELYEKLKDVYEIVGSGCDIYVDSKLNKSSFIDFFSSDDSVGVLTDNEIITGRLYEKFCKLKTYVEQNRINVY